MTLAFTFWDVVAIAAYLCLIYAGPVIATAAAALLAIPACRRVPVLHRIGGALLGLLGVLVLCSVPMLQEAWSDLARDAAYARATHHLTAPETFGGIAFPAGSTIHLDPEDGHPASGSVPQPTLIAGLTLVGDFRLEREVLRDAVTITDGVLAVPALVHGVPCGEGAVVAQDAATRCTLGRDYVFAGHRLARGTVIDIYRSPLNEPAQLRRGTLAAPELLYDVVWPPGSRIGGGIDVPPDRMAHAAGPERSIDLCAPLAGVVPTPWATLHGQMSLSVLGGRRLLSQVCDMLPADSVDLAAYAQVGPARYGFGEQAAPGAPWSWSDPMPPDPPGDAAR